MGYHDVSLDEIEPHPEHECDRRTIAEAVDLDHVGLSRYLAEPGEQVPQHYHLHETQEELFYVVEGEMHVETPEGTFEVTEDHVFVVEPGNYHRAYNPKTANGTLHVVAIGGPNVSDGRIHEADPAYTGEDS
ncbi:MAG: cupin domain-containing protein [Haloferacaceae archaeon]